MQLGYTGHVVRSEWRWLFLVSIMLILITILPLLIVSLNGLQTESWQFMGAIYAPSDSAALLSRMLRGSHGEWIQTFQYTPDIHQGALVQPIYTVLGYLGRPDPSSLIILFHMVRLTAGLLMFVAIYQLGASIWVKIRTRRIFFIISSMGSGVGWLLLLATNRADSIDFTVPQSFPLLSSMLNIHFPLAIATSAMLVAIIISAFRPGSQTNPAVDNAGIFAFLLSIGLAILYPEALVALGIAVIGSILMQWFNHGYSVREVRWGLWILVPALPIVTYYLITLELNPTVSAWVIQRSRNDVTLMDILLGCAIPLVIAIPGMARGIRRLEADGDRLMILWLGAMIMLALLPLPLNGFALVGLMLPIAYFATRSIEDFWFRLILRRYRRYFYVIFAVMMPLSYVYLLFIPIYPIVQFNRGTDAMIAPSYIPALQWIESRTDPLDVILASPRVSRWVPFWADARTYYGHPTETIQAERRLQEVLDWYRMDDSDQCNDILYWRPIINNNYPIRFVIMGPHERALGKTVCVNDLSLVATFNDVQIYSTALSLSIP